MTSQNPLSAYFRNPVLYVQLPSGGKYWADQSLKIPPSGEFAVLSMTAMDEILLKTPDALINGEATVNLIQSCVPNILDAWSTPSIDLEYLLIAIRIASLGEKLPIEPECPHCKESSSFELDLRGHLETFDLSVWSQRFEINELIFNFQPLNYKKINHYENIDFQNQKQLRQIAQIEDIEIKEKVINDILLGINQNEVEYVIDSIKGIYVNNVLVENKEHIAEFVKNCDRKMFSQIREWVTKLKSSTRCNDIKIVCQNCDKEFSSSFSLDYANFFDLSS